MHSEPSDNPDNPERVLSNQTDVELYFALKKGQTIALGILYDRHAGLVYGLALKALGNAQEAEDLTQDIFLNLTKITSYDPKRGSLRTFLAVLTRSRAIDRIRSRTTKRSLLNRLKPRGNLENSTNSPLETVFQNERSQQVQSALAQLSESQQQLIRMAYYDGLSQSEIAAQLQMPLGTVKTRTRQGLLKLRQNLLDYIR
jgi:RNA polymerase sigma-70 factor (ECF subfamily)